MEPFRKKVLLASPYMHTEEMQFVKDAFEKNWITTAGENIDALEEMVAKRVGVKYAVGLTNGTAALHMAIKLAAQDIYGKSKLGRGALYGRKVFCSDMTFDATVNPVVYEDGEPIFIDTEYDTWNMDPKALEKAFELYPEVKIVVVAHLYGFVAKIDEIKKIADEHGAIIVEDAAESFGATLDGKETGSFGKYAVVSFNGNKIITASAGGMLLTNEKAAYEKVRKWSTQAREAAPWYQHEELGYNYRMSNVVAGVGRGQMLHLDEHIAMKKAIFDRYKEGFKGLPVTMNPFDDKRVSPNYWLSCLVIDNDAMGAHVRSDNKALFNRVSGKTTPTEILETLASYNAEGRPIWKPMHMQPIYVNNEFITKTGSGRARTNAYIDGQVENVGRDIFDRGVCLPSDLNMTEEAQMIVIDIIRGCF